MAFIPLLLRLAPACIIVIIAITLAVIVYTLFMYWIRGGVKLTMDTTKDTADWIEDQISASDVDNNDSNADQSKVK